jgi:hypothetical protein
MARYPNDVHGRRLSEHLLLGGARGGWFGSCGHLLSSFLLDDWTAYTRIMQQISKVIKSCIYNRLLLGYSLLSPKADIRPERGETVAQLLLENGPVHLDSPEAKRALRDLLEGETMVFGSSVLTTSTQAPRHVAALATLSGSKAAHVPHLVAVDSTSHDQVAHELRRAGAIVVIVDHATEGGLFRPYMLLARTVDKSIPDATYIKFELEKNVVRNPDTADVLRAAAGQYHVFTGVRTPDTIASMAPYQGVTEAPLALALSIIAGVPYDTPSGVIGFSSNGRAALYDFEGKDWGYLITAPHTAKRWGLRVGEVNVDFRYHYGVVAEEMDNPEQDRKRRKQILAMRDAAVRVAGGYEALSHAQRRAGQSITDMVRALCALAGEPTPAGA